MRNHSRATHLTEDFSIWIAGDLLTVAVEVLGETSSSSSCAWRRWTWAWAPLSSPARRQPTAASLRNPRNGSISSTERERGNHWGGLGAEVDACLPANGVGWGSMATTTTTRDRGRRGGEGTRRSIGMGGNWGRETNGLDWDWDVAVGKVGEVGELPLGAWV